MASSVQRFRRSGKAAGALRRPVLLATGLAVGLAVSGLAACRDAPVGDDSSAGGTPALAAEEELARIKTAPFSAVRWEGRVPTVRVGRDWFGLRSIDGVPIGEIVDLIAAERPDFYEKVFSEDLVEIMQALGRPLRATVSVELLDGDTSVERRLPLTRKDRNDAWAYNQGIEDLDLTPIPPTPTPVPIADLYSAWIDSVWEETPMDNTGTLRFQLMRDGTAFVSDVAVGEVFEFMASGEQTVSQAFKPNYNGRWVLQGLPAGRYDLTVVGIGPMEGFSWQRGGFDLESGTAPRFEVEMAP